MRDLEAVAGVEGRPSEPGSAVVLRVGLDDRTRRAIAAFDGEINRLLGAMVADVSGPEAALLRWERWRGEGRSVALLVSARTPERDLLRLARLLRGGGSWAPLVLLAEAADGAAVERAVAERYSDFLLTYEADAERLVRAVRFALEVSARRIADEQARRRRHELERDLEAVTSRVEEGLLWVDQRRRVRSWNRRAEEILGRGGAELQGLPFSALGWVEPPTARAGMAAGPAGDGVPLELERPDGTRLRILVRSHLLATSEPGEERVRLVLLQEGGGTSERAGAERRLIGIGRIATSVAHDVNNLLTPVLGYADGLCAELGPESVGGRHAAEIARSAQFAADLLRRLLEAARTPAATVVPIVADEAVAATLPLLRTVAGKLVRVETDLAASSARVDLRPGDLEQLLLNLATNARDAMPEGGELALRSATEGGAWRLEVEDTGAGFLAEPGQRPFEAGYTTKADQAAGGFGLWIVHGIVADAGGEVALEGGPGGGARVVVRLPLSPARRYQPSK